MFLIRTSITSYLTNYFNFLQLNLNSPIQHKPFCMRPDLIEGRVKVRTIGHSLETALPYIGEIFKVDIEREFLEIFSAIKPNSQKSGVLDPLYEY